MPDLPDRPLQLLASTVTRQMGDLSECYEGYDESDPTAILYDARHWKRAAAIRHHASEYGGEFAKVACATRYARWLTRQQQWDAGGHDRWYDEPDEHVTCPVCGRAPGERCDGADDLPDGGHEERRDAVPNQASDGWEADDYDPAWEFCARDDGGAIKVYRCEVS
jgi:hypothetical protein